MALYPVKVPMLPRLHHQNLQEFHNMELPTLMSLCAYTHTLFLSSYSMPGTQRRVAFLLITGGKGSWGEPPPTTMSPTKRNSKIRLTTNSPLPFYSDFIMLQGPDPVCGPVAQSSFPPTTYVFKGQNSCGGCPHAL